MKATFVGELAATLRGALGPEADRLWRRHREDRRSFPELAAPGRGQLLAEALADLVRRGLAADTTLSRAPVIEASLVITDPTGPTDMFNLASLCRRHHGVVHSAGWTMRSTDHQWFEFTSPAGITTPSQRHQHLRQQE